MRGVGFNDAVVYQETGKATAESMASLVRELRRLQFDRGATLRIGENLLKLYMQDSTPPHPDIDSTLGLWVRTQPAGPWIFYFSGKKSSGTRGWFELGRASS